MLAQALAAAGGGLGGGYAGGAACCPQVSHPEGLQQVESAAQWRTLVFEDVVVAGDRSSEEGAPAPSGAPPPGGANGGRRR